MTKSVFSDVDSTGEKSFLSKRWINFQQSLLPAGAITLGLVLSVHLWLYDGFLAIVLFILVVTGGVLFTEALRIYRNLRFNVSDANEPFYDHRKLVRLVVVCGTMFSWVFSLWVYGISKDYQIMFAVALLCFVLLATMTVFVSNMPLNKEQVGPYDKYRVKPPFPTPPVVGVCIMSSSDSIEDS